MRAVDTNIIVRYLVGDDPAQAETARHIIGQEPVFVPRTVILEVEWVLRGAYKLKTGKIIAAIRALAGLPGLSLESASLIAKALDWTEAGMDFADALHRAAASDCDAFLTFDKKFVGSAASQAGVPVNLP